mmetsp:Transcript_27542/g.70142  ORF Transcript_27542/g.70142 Transcript_27542/m.70142 type:complete len:354 (-) Transcript_27542:258-1319(-)
MSAGRVVTCTEGATHTLNLASPFTPTPIHPSPAMWTSALLLNQSLPSTVMSRGVHAGSSAKRSGEPGGTSWPPACFCTRSSAPSVLPMCRLTKDDTNTVRYRVPPGWSSTSTRARPPSSTVLPAARRYVRPTMPLLGSTCLTSAGSSSEVSWWLCSTPGVSNARCLGPRGRPGTLMRPSVVPGMGAMVGSPRPAVPPSRFMAAMSDDLPAFCAPTTHRSPLNPSASLTPSASACTPLPRAALTQNTLSAGGSPAARSRSRTHCVSRAGIASLGSKSTLFRATMSLNLGCALFVGISSSPPSSPSSPSAPSPPSVGPGKASEGAPLGAPRAAPRACDATDSLAALASAHAASTE